MFTKLHPHDLQWPVEWRRTRTLTSLPDRKSVFQMGSLIRFIMFDTSLMLFVQIRNNKKKRKKSTNAPLNYILKRKEKKLHLSHVFLLFFLWSYFICSTMLHKQKKKKKKGNYQRRTRTILIRQIFIQALRQYLSFLVDRASGERLIQHLYIGMLR